MSVATEITRINTAKNNIKTAIENKGVSVPSAALIDQYSTYIDQITLYDDREMEDPLFFMTSGSAGTIGIRIVGSPTAKTFYYSLDDMATWTAYEPLSTATMISVPAKSRIFWKSNSSTCSTDANNYYRFMFTQYFSAGGNIMSLLGENWKTNRTLTAGCFAGLFINSTNLQRAPQLPATNAPENCYRAMFYGCTNINEAPVLPALTVGNSAYRQMFYGCTKIVKTPDLPATTIGESAYRQMFYGCTKLTYPPKTIAAVNIGTYCMYQMFYGCTAMYIAPELIAATLTQACYGGIFYNCSKLNKIKLRATDISAESCLENWVYGVAASGNIEVTSAIYNTIPSGSSGVPNGWTKTSV